MASEPKNLALILARQMASNLATAMAVLDAEGTLAFFNEAAGGVLGQPFSETGELSRDELLSRLVPEDLQGNTIPIEELPISVALIKREPAHRTVCITGLDGK
ncbi:MAG: PAS domain-containing protein, partial [Actinomycetota bacterium]